MDLVLVARSFRVESGRELNLLVLSPFGRVKSEMQVVAKHASLNVFNLQFRHTACLADDEFCSIIKGKGLFQNGHFLTSLLFSSMLI